MKRNCFGALQQENTSKQFLFHQLSNGDKFILKDAIERKLLDNQTNSLVTKLVVF